MVLREILPCASNFSIGRTRWPQDSKFLKQFYKADQIVLKLAKENVTIKKIEKNCTKLT